MEDYIDNIAEEEEEQLVSPIQELQEFYEENSFDLVEDNKQLDHIPISVVKFVKALARDPRFTKPWYLNSRIFSILRYLGIYPKKRNSSRSRKLS